MYCFYELFLKPHPRQGSLTSKIKHFKRGSLPLSILGWSYFPVTTLKRYSSTAAVLLVTLLVPMLVPL